MLMVYPSSPLLSSARSVFRTRKKASFNREPPHLKLSSYLFFFPSLCLQRTIHEIMENRGFLRREDSWQYRSFFMLNIFRRVIFCVFLTRHAIKPSFIVTFYRDLLLSYCFLFKVERISNYFLPFPEFLLHEFWQYELFLTFLFLSGNSDWVSKTCKRRHCSLN